jgi:CHASE3 domain sensor protein
MRIQIGRTQSVGFGFVLTLLLLNAGVSCWNTLVLHRSDRWVAHTYQVISAIDSSLLAMEQAEAG